MRPLRRFSLSNALNARATRTIFWVACTTTLALALWPKGFKVLFLNDKAEHLLSFFVLTLLGVAAFGKRRLPIVVIGLAAMGAAIELLQGTSLIRRDADFFDWIADLAGLGLALLPVLFVGFRRRNLD